MGVDMRAQPRSRDRIVSAGRGLAAAWTLAFAFALVPQAVAERAQQSGSGDSFARFVEQVWPEARSAGVTRETFEAAFSGVRPDPSILEAENRQPEFVRPVWEYMDRAVSGTRIRQGRTELARHDTRLREIERRYGVERHYLVAIWGMETSYGANMGSHNIIQALATLAHGGRRAAFGREQLIAALKILQSGDVTPERMTGSWAGAMGHTQFIPTTYASFAVDHTGDGQRDIWRSTSDALASTANYLSASGGWNNEVRWGFEVQLPEGFDYSSTGLDTRKLTAEWVALGVERIDGQSFTQWAEQASIIVPAGAHGPAFIVFGNFRAVLRYNNSIAYALAVCHLADRLRGRPAIVQDWPRSDNPLTSEQTMELQRLLAGAGFSIGEIDGRVGPRTQAALREYQRGAGLVPDGYASAQVLERLRQGG
jgi:membrane-bound lytic murein transglycosylase B